MGLLVEINGPRNKSERPAQERLAEILPPTWIVTTNIKERQFQYNKREIDCLIICPLGIFNIDLKNHNGPITPLVNDEWRGVKYDGGKEENPFDQGENAVFTVKQHLKKRHPGDRWWIEWLVVLTSGDATLDWAGSDCEDFQRVRVCLLDDVQKHIERLAQDLRFKPDARQAQLVLEAFKAKDLASHTDFIEKNWPASASAQKQNRARPSEAASVEYRPPTSYGSSWPNLGPQEQSIETQIEEMFSSRRSARESTPETLAQARAIPPSAPAAYPQSRATPRAIGSKVWNPIVGNSLGLAACLCLVFYAVSRMTYCDKACEYRRSAAAERQHIAALPAPPPAPRPATPPREVHALNTSASCPGIEVHEYVTGRKPFNPNKCAWARGPEGKA